MASTLGPDQDDNRAADLAGQLPTANAARWPRVEDLVERGRADGVDPESLVTVQKAIAAILLAHDPAGAAQSGRADEYAPEAQTIALQLHQVRTETELAELVRAELTWWFAPATGRPDQIQAIAAAIWPLSPRSA